MKIIMIIAALGLFSFIGPASADANCICCTGTNGCVPCDLPVDQCQHPL